MNIYESLNETVTLKKRFDLICDFPITIFVRMMLNKHFKIETKNINIKEM